MCLEVGVLEEYWRIGGEKGNSGGFGEDFWRKVEYFISVP
jgi:hypothetical protein